ncbi:MAG: pyrimidine 5'-nucleotidase [Sphingomonadaceae bacterium]|nr:pyrimidine 5'-nucleotidase [Sphingomonadaceae bacterium]
MTPALAHIETWIFDLDNTLYPASANLFAQIDARMSAYIRRLLDVPHGEAVRIQKHFFHTHGTTLSGLMREHEVSPQDFYGFVHDIDMEVLAEDRRLVDAIAALPGRKLVFTNGDERYARKVLAKLGLSESFEAIHDIEACGFVPKPDPAAYRSMCERQRVAPETALFMDDMARNLAPAKALGMTTVWIDNGSEQGPAVAAPDFIDFAVGDPAGWLHGILGEI